MQDKLQALMQASPVTGLAVALIENNSMMVNCLGTFEDHIVSPQTVWPAASLTKPVFVFGVLQLVQQGLLELDLPLQTYLDEPYIEDAVYLPHMTARHAMSHSTGFPNWRDDQGLRANFHPGTQFSYSSEGLNYLQYVVERLLGTSMDEYLRKNVFLPFNMARSELRRETEATVPPFLMFLTTAMPANGALSLWTTIEDYTCFVMRMFDNTGSDLYCLNHDLLKTMLTPQIGVGMYSNLYWGLGWGLQEQDGELSFWHWGSRSTPRAMSFIVGWPDEQKTIVIFTNHFDGLYLCRDIIHSLFPQKSSLPAFEWLLPAQQWSANGLRSAI